MSGFYYYVTFDEETNINLENFCIENNIKNYTTEFHCTICDSTSNVNFSISENPISNIIFKKWEYWEDSKGNLILVAIIKSDYLERKFDALKLLGIQTNFQVYNPHITICYKVEEIYENLPPLNFNITIKKENITTYK